MNLWRKSLSLLLAWVMLWATTASAAGESMLASRSAQGWGQKIASGGFGQKSCTASGAAGQLNPNTRRGWHDGNQEIASDIGDTYDYDAFGNLITSTGSTINNYLFAGEWFDSALGIYYNRARYYDQCGGRFWTMDTWEGVLGILRAYTSISMPMLTQLIGLIQVEMTASPK